MDKPISRSGDGHNNGPDGSSGATEPSRESYGCSSTLNSTWLGPVSETYSISPAGSGPHPFQDNAATIYTIANTGAMLLFGQDCSIENTALAAGPRCAPDPTPHLPLVG